MSELIENDSNLAKNLHMRSIQKRVEMARQKGMKWNEKRNIAWKEFTEADYKWEAAWKKHTEVWIETEKIWEKVHRALCESIETIKNMRHREEINDFRKTSDFLMEELRQITEIRLNEVKNEK